MLEKVWGYVGVKIQRARAIDEVQEGLKLHIEPAGIDGRFVTAGGALGGVVSKVAWVQQPLGKARPGGGAAFSSNQHRHVSVPVLHNNSQNTFAIS
jgi:hypothetical protein